ncbi:hypothetical protein LX36DRAFT_219271 [Colletotrichum falcatum]|nr:hypothetical protein LX36DRAFT_219271 [Colletotrichum falcatum]
MTMCRLIYALYSSAGLESPFSLFSSTHCAECETPGPVPKAQTGKNINWKTLEKFGKSQPPKPEGVAAVLITDYDCGRVQYARDSRLTVDSWESALGGVLNRFETILLLRQRCSRESHPGHTDDSMWWTEPRFAFMSCRGARV